MPSEENKDYLKEAKEQMGVVFDVIAIQKKVSSLMADNQAHDFIWENQKRIKKFEAEIKLSPKTKEYYKGLEFRLKLLENKVLVLEHFDDLKIFNEKLERIEVILTRLIEIEFENYHVSPYDDDILQKLYKQIKK